LKKQYDHGFFEEAVLCATCISVCFEEEDHSFDFEEDHSFDLPTIRGS
jgi:hypothetical protein